MKKDITKLSKKELKDYVNKNGFYFHMNCDTIELDEAKKIKDDLEKNSAVQTGVSIPEWEDVIIYRGIASQNYGRGEKNRNGYKYDQKGWDFKDYFLNPIILFQHDMEQPIGNALNFWWDQENNLNIMFFVYKNALEGADKFRVEKELIKAISTGAISDEHKFEDNETGELYDEDEAKEKFGWENVWDAFWGMSDFLTLVITKARMLENSLVTLGSNEKAMAVQNGIAKFAEEKAEAFKLKYERNETKEEEGKEEEPEDEKGNNKDAEETKEESVDRQEEQSEEVVEEEENTDKDEDGKEEEAQDDESKEEDGDIGDDWEGEDKKEYQEGELDGNNDDKQDKDTDKTSKNTMTIELEYKEISDLLNTLDWKISEMSEMAESVNDIKKSNEKLADVVENTTKNQDDLKKDFEDKVQEIKKDHQTTVKDLTDQVEELEKCNEWLFKVVTDLNKKLKNTVFDSAMAYKPEKKAQASPLAQKIVAATNNS